MHQRCGKNILRFEVFGFPDFLVVKGFQEKIGLTNFGLKNCLIFQLLLASTLNILVWVPKNCNFQSIYTYNGIVFRGIAIIIESQMQYLATYRSLHWHKNMVKQCHWPHFKQSHVVLKSPKANMISCQNLSTVAIVSRVLTIG